MFPNEANLLAELRAYAEMMKAVADSGFGMYNASRSGAFRDMLAFLDRKEAEAR